MSTLKATVQTAYNSLIRKRLPKRLGVKSGVAVRADRLLDTTWIDQTVEEPCVDAHQRHVRPGDDVVIIGGGWGVTPVHAARQGGDVTVFEAASEHVDIVAETARLNQASDAISVEHALVGDAVDVWGDDVGRTVAPADLPACDVLEIDAEGAELSILDGLTIRPRVLVVEYHPPLGVDRVAVVAALDELGYTIVEEAVEEPDEAIVLTAVHGD